MFLVFSMSSIGFIIDDVGKAVSGLCRTWFLWFGWFELLPRVLFVIMVVFIVARVDTIFVFLFLGEVLFGYHTVTYGGSFLMGFVFLLIVD